jgi:hypothetical protein
MVCDKSDLCALDRDPTTRPRLVTRIGVVLCEAVSFAKIGEGFSFLDTVIAAHNYLVDLTCAKERQNS